MSDPEDFKPGFVEDEPTLTPLARAVLWAACCVLACMVIAVLLACISVLIGGHYWWLR